MTIALPAVQSLVPFINIDMNKLHIPSRDWRVGPEDWAFVLHSRSLSSLSSITWCPSLVLPLATTGCGQKQKTQNNSMVRWGVFLCDCDGALVVVERGQHLGTFMQGAPGDFVILGMSRMGQLREKCQTLLKILLYQYISQSNYFLHSTTLYPLHMFFFLQLMKSGKFSTLWHTKLCIPLCCLGDRFCGCQGLLLLFFFSF